MLVVPMFLMYSGGMNIAKADSTTLDYTCEATAPIVGALEIEMEVEVNGNAPDTVEAGEEFSITESYTVVTLLDTSLMKIAMSQVEGEVTTFNLTAENAFDAANGDNNTINVADPAITIPTTPFPDEGNTVTIQVLGRDRITVPPITAGDEGEIEISAGNIVTELDSNLGDIVANCSPDSGQDLVVNTIEITEDDGEDPEVPEEPVLEVVGDNPMELKVGDSYVEEGVTVDGEENEDVVITDRKSTRLNSSHVAISYAVFCLK